MEPRPRILAGLQTALREALVMLHLLLALILSPATGRAEPVSGSRSVLWQAPRPLTMSDWVWGPGGEAHAPQPPFRFVRENLGGTNPKIDVRDSRGALWVVKFGGE